MFCPSCKDEFRPGFTRCAGCDVDLVESLDAPVESAPAPQTATGTSLEEVVPMRDYCGFFDLGEARAARERLRAAQIRSEIAIRDMPGTEPIEEEYWLRVEANQLQQAAAHVDADTSSAEGAEKKIQCSECGSSVTAEESFCFNCGARFGE